MKLLIKQRVFAWTDTFDIYDEFGNKRYYVRGEFFTLGHRLHVYDMTGQEIGCVRQRIWTWLPTFEIEVLGRHLGQIKRRWSFFRQNYEIRYMNWDVQGDFLGWNYNVYDGSRTIAYLNKEIFHWGDTYVIDIADPRDELHVLMLILSIDAANCCNG